MKIKIPYNDKEIDLEIESGSNAYITVPTKIILASESKTIRKALNNPIDSLTFEKWTEKYRNFLFIINDASRPTPTFKILKEINKITNIEEARYIIATGAHRKPTVPELKSIFGNFYERIKTKITIHDAKDDKNLKYLGTTKRGTEVWINKEITEAGALIPIGSVEPHYFAGFTGGRKSFIPGVAGYETIEQNHSLALKKETSPLKLKNNPVHTDLLDAFNIIPRKPIFSIQSIVKNEKDLCAVFCGEIHESFYKACEYASDVFSVPVKEKADIVITAVKPPLDKNLYQAHKAIEHGRLILKEGGILILVASCREGIGPDNFYKLLSSSDNSDKIIKKAKEDYHLGYHKAARIAEFSKTSEIYLVSEIKDRILANTFIKFFDSLQEAFDKSLETKGKNASILIIRDGGNTIPKIDTRYQVPGTSKTS